MQLILPCSPTLLRNDRFSLLDSDDDEVPFWRILESILSSRIASWGELIEQLDTISVIFHSSSLPDFAFLRDFLQNDWASKEAHFFSTVWPAIVQLALEMPRLFPEHSLPCLTAENPKVLLSRRQVGCLVVHQFLCSLPSQPWNTDSSQDFRIWYSSGSRHPSAVKTYLCALFTYFERLSGSKAGRESESAQALPSPLLHEWPITFTLRTLGEKTTAQLDPALLERELCPLEITQLPTQSTDPSLLGLPNGASVISANKNVGFGQTGTQEEVNAGTTPECCPITLLAPTLRHDQVLIVRGVEAMVSLKGYGRDATLDQALSADYGDLSGDAHSSKWRRRTMLFMDALELDLFDPAEGIADLMPGHVDREVLKAYNAFSSGIGSEPGDGDSYINVVTGLWGCGTFRGNSQIKTVLQWCAASMAGTSLRLVLSGDGQGAFGRDLANVVARAGRDSWTVRDVLGLIGALKPSDPQAKVVFSYLLEALSQPSS
ncbi:hypothetical protein FQN55_002505 [Onygenales sp. PD_40]|nr:hypothetical protein FQN55_002505 [Onygenales sp. PD_40]